MFTIIMLLLCIYIVGILTLVLKKTLKSILLITSYKILMMHAILSHENSIQFGIREPKCDYWLRHLLRDCKQASFGLLIRLMERISCTSMLRGKRTKQYISPLSEHSFAWKSFITQFIIIHFDNKQIKSHLLNLAD